MVPIAPIQAEVIVRGSILMTCTLDESVVTEGLASCTFGQEARLRRSFHPTPSFARTNWHVTMHFPLQVCPGKSRPISPLRGKSYEQHGMHESAYSLSINKCAYASIRVSFGPNAYWCLLDPISSAASSAWLIVRLLDSATLLVQSLCCSENPRIDALTVRRALPLLLLC